MPPIMDFDELRRAWQALPKTETEALVRAYDEALDVLQQESPPYKFWHLCQEDYEETARRLSLYWSERRRIFPEQERYLYPLRLTGHEDEEGHSHKDHESDESKQKKNEQKSALTPNTKLVIQKGATLILPQHDQNDRPVILVDQSRFNHVGINHGDSVRVQVLFYHLHTLFLDMTPQDLEKGYSILFVVDLERAVKVTDVKQSLDTNSADASTALSPPTPSPHRTSIRFLLSKAIPMRLQAVHFLLPQRETIFDQKLQSATSQLQTSQAVLKIVKQFQSMPSQLCSVQPQVHVVPLPSKLGPWKSKEIRQSLQKLLQDCNLNDSDPSQLPPQIGGNLDHDAVKQSFYLKRIAFEKDQISWKDSIQQAKGSDCFERLHDAMSRLPHEQRDAYETAMSHAPSVVREEWHPQKFLDSCCHDYWKAASKILQYWTFRREVYGNQRYFLPLESTKNGVNALAPAAQRLFFETGGAMMVVPTLDKTKRPILLFDQSKVNHPNLPPSTFLKYRTQLFFFLLHNLFANSVEARDNGLSVLFAVDLLGSSDLLHHFTSGIDEHEKLPSKFQIIQLCLSEVIPIRIQEFQVLIPQTQSTVSFLKQQCMNAIMCLIKRLEGFKELNPKIHYVTRDELETVIDACGLVGPHQIPRRLGGTLEFSLARNNGHAGGLAPTIAETTPAASVPSRDLRDTADSDEKGRVVKRPRMQENNLQIQGG